MNYHNYVRFLTAFMYSKFLENEIYFFRKRCILVRYDTQVMKADDKLAPLTMCMYDTRRDRDRPKYFMTSYRDGSEKLVEKIISIIISIVNISMYL